MYIVKVDENNVVVSVNRTDDPAQFPSYMRLDDSYILSVSPVLPGQVYANETATFGAAPRNRWVTKLTFDTKLTRTICCAPKYPRSYRYYSRALIWLAILTLTALIPLPVFKHWKLWVCLPLVVPLKSSMARLTKLNTIGTRDENGIGVIQP